MFPITPYTVICYTDMEVVKQVLKDRADLLQKVHLNPIMESILHNGIVLSNRSLEADRKVI